MTNEHIFKLMNHNYKYQHDFYFTITIYLLHKKQHVDINFYTPSNRPVVEKGHTLLNNYNAVSFVFSLVLSSFFFASASSRLGGG